MKKRILLLSFIALSSIPAFAQNVPSYVPSNGLVGWWPFNGNANDESGNGNNGVVMGATLFSDRWGQNNKAFYFNGINNFIQISDQPSFNFVNYSLSFWCINDPMSNLSVKYLFNKGCYPNLSFRFYFDGSPISDISTQNNLQFVSGPPPSTSWNNYITTYDGIQIKLYINGNLVDSDFFQGFLNDTNEPLIIGARQDGQNCQVQSHFYGAIDDIGIWNRALSQQEITDLYNGTSAQTNENSLPLASVHPNPTTGEITITSNELHSQFYSLYNSLGQLVASGMLNAENTTLSIQEFAPGIYTLQLQGEKNTTLKIVKE